MAIQLNPFLGQPLDGFLAIGTYLLLAIVLWRMMRAHERLAAAIEKFERVTRPGESGPRP